MTRMLEALKSLESRESREPANDARPSLPAGSRLGADSPAPVADSPPNLAEDVPTGPSATTESAAGYQVCTLPTKAEVAAHYLEMAGEISGQAESTYCNVLLFASADRWVEPCFSMIELARAFVLELGGDVLLVDGDLRFGRLSSTVATPGPGMIEVMRNQAQWTEVIRPTNDGHIDFVARGSGHVPTVEQPNFGWGALRPLYRAVLIGLAAQAEGETTWLAARCDAVYFVLSRPHTRRGAASAAINSLRAAGANVAGSIVVND